MAYCHAGKSPVFRRSSDALEQMGLTFFAEYLHHFLEQVVDGVMTHGRDPDPLSRAD